MCNTKNQSVWYLIIYLFFFKESIFFCFALTQTIWARRLAEKEETWDQPRAASRSHDSIPACPSLHKECMCRWGELSSKRSKLSLNFRRKPFLTRFSLGDLNFTKKCRQKPNCSNSSTPTPHQSCRGHFGEHPFYYSLLDLCVSSSLFQRHHGEHSWK